MVLACFVAVQSCTDLLNEPGPSTQTSQEEALTTVPGIESTRAYMYAQLHSFTYTTAYMLGPSSMADGMYRTPGANRFSGLNANARGAHLGSWNIGYETINQANLLIDAIPEGVISPELETQYRGEAFFMRAFAYHHMVRAYGYEPGVTPNFGQGAGWQKGVPVRTNPVLSPDDATFLVRSTVTEVYEQIESDLLNAISLLEQGDAGVPHYATDAAAKALLARVYLYWQKYDLADQYATEALQSSPAQLATPGEVGTIFDAGSTVELIFQGLINNPLEESQGVNSALAAYTSQQWMAQAPTQDQMDLYSSSDARLAWFGRCFREIAGTPATCLATHPAVEGGAVTLELEKWNGDLGNYADNIPYFRAAEMVLIQVEARLKGTGGVAAAIIRLNEFRASRGLGPYTGLTTPEAVMDEILIERRREFVGEGHRFWDLKRLGLAIRKAPETLNDPGIAIVPFNDFKIIAPLPNDAIELSQDAAERGIIPQDSVLVQNPEY